jgi:hypothetical protein
MLNLNVETGFPRALVVVALQAVPVMESRRLRVAGMTDPGENRGTHAVPTVVTAPPRRVGLLVSTLSGAVAGAMLSLFIGPKLVGWLYEPTGREAVSCHVPVNDALVMFVWIQIAITVVVSLLFLVAVLLLQQRGRRS